MSISSIRKRPTISILKKKKKKNYNPATLMAQGCMARQSKAARGGSTVAPPDRFLEIPQLVEFWLTPSSTNLFVLPLSPFPRRYWISQHHQNPCVLRAALYVWVDLLTLTFRRYFELWFDQLYKWLVDLGSILSTFLGFRCESCWWKKWKVSVAVQCIWSNLRFSFLFVIYYL